MIYLQRKVKRRPSKTYRQSTNNEHCAQQLEEQGYERLTGRQFLCQIAAPNIILDPIVPFICGAICFFALGRLGPYTLLDFIAAYVIADAVAHALTPLQR